MVAVYNLIGFKSRYLICYRMSNIFWKTDKTTCNFIWRRRKFLPSPRFVMFAIHIVPKLEPGYHTNISDAYYKTFKGSAPIYGLIISPILHETENTQQPTVWWGSSQVEKFVCCIHHSKIDSHQYRGDEWCLLWDTSVLELSEIRISISPLLRIRTWENSPSVCTPYINRKGLCASKELDSDSSIGNGRDIGIDHICSNRFITTAYIDRRKWGLMDVKDFLCKPSQARKICVAWKVRSIVDSGAFRIWSL